MKYEKIIDDSILYIKKHINEDLTAQNIANHVGYSVFHFCRIFSLITNLTVMEYIRKYRLSIARSELKGNKKLLMLLYSMVLKPPAVLQNHSAKNLVIRLLRILLE